MGGGGWELFGVRGEDLSLKDRVECVRGRGCRRFGREGEMRVREGKGGKGKSRKCRGHEGRGRERKDGR